MANEEHLAILRQGVKVWNEWRKKNPQLKPDLSHADLGFRNLAEANLAGVNLSNATLRKSDLTRANLSKAWLTSADLGATKLVEANLTGSDLSKAELRSYPPPDLAFMVINESVDTDYSVSLHKANLAQANLREAVFHDAYLSHANLFRANLQEANLRNVSLTEADLREVNFSEAYIQSSSLTGSDLSGAKFARTTLGNVDLSSVKGLERVEHEGPSTIGIDTIYKSKGNITEVFLRGCGVPETMISHVASLVGTRIQFYSAFISYSTKDQEFAERLHADLQSKGVRVWFGPRDVEGGKKLHDQVDQAIQVYDKLLLVLSENSLQSEWVMTEIRKARKQEIKEKRRKLFPVRLMDFERLREWECFDADSGKDLAVEVREYFIPDFCKWKDRDCYQMAFARLVRDLQPEEEKTNP